MTQSIFFDVIARDKASSTFSRVGKASETARGRLLGFSKSAVGAALGFTSITLAAGAFVRVGADYVGALNKIQALTGANDATIRRAAKTLESNSSAYAKMGQTVGDAAGGVVELTKAGLSLDKSLKAVNATMVLAKAGEMSVADASSLVANTLNTFHLKAKSAGDIANYLANAANISSADVTDLAESLKYVAPVAASTGVNLKQTSAILAELSNSGIAASNAGTGFRKFLLSLQAPSGKAKTDLHDLGVEIFDAQGKMKPLGTVIDLLAGKLNKLTDQQRQKVLKDVFGLQGISSATVILKGGAKGLEQYAKGVTKAGAAQKLAEAGSKGFAGTLAALRAEVISDAQAAYRKLSPALDDAAKKLLAFVQQMKSGKGAGGDFAAALKSLATIAGGALKILNDLPGPVKRFGIEGLIAYSVLRRLTAATTGFGLSLASPIAKTKQFYAEMTYAETRSAALGNAMQKLGPVLQNISGTAGMLLLADSTHRVGKSMGTLEMAAGGALSGAALGAFAGPVGAAVGGAIGGLAGAAVGLSHSLGSVKKATKETLPPLQSYIDTLDAASGATTRLTKARALDNLSSQHAIEKGHALGLSTKTLVNASLGVPAAQAKVRAAVVAADKALTQSTYHFNKHGQVVATMTAEQRKAAQGADALAVAIGTATEKSDKDIISTRDRLIELGKYKKVLPGIPKDVVSKIDLIGLDKARGNIVDLTRKYHLTPKQVKTILTAANVPATARDIQYIINLAKQYGSQHPSATLDANTKPAKDKLTGIMAYLHSIISTPWNIPVTVTRHGGGKSGGSSGGVGGLLGQTTGGRLVSGGRGSSRLMENAGRSTGDSYARGVDRSRSTVKAALAKFTALASKAAEKLSSLKDIKSGFLSTFQSDNLFGTDLSGGGGISTLLDMEQKQAARASQLLADIKSLTSRGLSKSLISQLQAQGTSGADALRALASGSAAQIQQFNALDAQAQTSLQSAGLLAGNSVRGGSINADINSAAAEDARLERLLRKLRHIQGDDVVVINIDSEEIIRVIKKRNKRKGVKTAGM